MNCLITGHRGFVGSHLMDVMDDAVGLDKKDGFDLATDSIHAELERLDFKPHIVIHLAASCSTSKSIDNPYQDFQDNVVGTFNVLEYCRQTGTPIIFTSSCKSGTGTPYGTSKLTGELYVKEYHDTYGIDYIINRPGTIYGPRQEASDESGWLGWFIKASLTSKPITIYGDGKQSRDVLYVKDYIRLIQAQIKHFYDYSGHTYDIGGGEKNELELLEVLQILGYTNFKHENERIGDVRRFVASNNIDGWEPTTNYMDGIQKTIKYYKGIL